MTDTPGFQRLNLTPKAILAIFRDYEITNLCCHGFRIHSHTDMSSVTTISHNSQSTERETRE